MTFGQLSVGATTRFARKISAPCLVVALSLATLCSAASAETQVLPFPGGPVPAGPGAERFIHGFAADGSNWIALTASTNVGSLPGTLRLSNDSGRSWRNIASAIEAEGITEGPDGFFYLVAQVFSGNPVVRAARVARVNPSSGAISYWPGSVSSARYGGYSPPTFDADGNAWVTAPLSHKVMKLSAAGQVLSTIEVPGMTTLYPENNSRIVINQFGLFVAVGLNLWRLDSGTMTRLPSVGAPEKAYDDGMLLFQRGISYDGGRTIFKASDSVAEVEGAGSSLIWAQGGLQRRYSDALFVYTGIEVPGVSVWERDRLIRAVQTTSGLLLVEDRSRGKAESYTQNRPLSNLYVHAGVIPESAPQPEGVAPDSQEMINQVNFLRSGSQLPPLVVDPVISQASRNHARYMVLNDVGHVETPGKEGFTGVNPKDRCASVGAQCLGGEIAYGGLVGRGAVTGWMTTIFHRFLIGSPHSSRVVGAGSWTEAPKGQASDMNDGDLPGAFTVKASFMPDGAWEGDLSFAGEIPDPGAECPDPATPIAAPYGAAVSVFLPRGSLAVKSMIVTNIATGKALYGCYFSPYNTFVPDEPLTAGTEYEGSAVVNSRDDSTYPESTLRWRFRTRAGTTPTVPQATPEPTPEQPPGSRPAKPKVLWSVSKRSRVVTAVITPVSGVSYRAVARSGKKNKAARCRNVKIRLGKRKVLRRSCRVKLARGRWVVPVIPKKQGIAGTANSKTFRFKR